MTGYRVFIPDQEVAVKTNGGEFEALHDAAVKEVYKWDAVREQDLPACPHCKTRGSIKMVEHGASVAYPVNRFYAGRPCPCYDLKEVTQDGHMHEYYCDSCMKTIYEEDLARGGAGSVTQNAG